MSSIKPDPAGVTRHLASVTAPRPNPSEADAIRAECREIEAMLIAKNAAYGNSALDPLRVFSQADPVEQIRVRLDDKLSRLKRGSAAGEDVTLDLIGYLVLLRIAERRECKRPAASSAD
jgi:hypothetical protein